MNRYKYLVEEINKNNALYYDNDAPVLTDMQYDALMLELKQIEEEHPEIISDNSPTRTVGGTVAGKFGKVTHITKQLSLSNAYSHDELREFDERIRKSINNITYICENKFDGLTVVLTYENGILTLGATRGDGITGEDVTNNIKTVRSVPHNLPKPYSLTLRGEVYMSKSTFEELNRQRAEKGEKLFANPRNAAAGSLRQLDSSITKERNLDMFAFNLEDIKDINITSHSQALELLRELGFSVSEYVVANNIDEVIEFVKEKEEKRDSLPFEIDGAVIKVDDFGQRQLLGTTAKSPRWATAYKFTPTLAESRVNEITVQVGRTGVLTPVANITPVIVGGSLISRATLHNEDFIKAKDIRVGDYVFVTKAGDVIPEITSVNLDKREDSLTPFEMPKFCPVCGSEVIKLPDEAAHRCMNIACEAQKKRLIGHFVSKDAMNIDGFGKSLSDRLCELGYLHDVSDIYMLKDRREELIKLDGLGEKSIDNLLSSIENSKSNDLSRLIGALGIPLVGTTVAKLICAYYPSMDILRNTKAEELSAIEGIGEKIALSVTDYFAQEHNAQIIDKLISYGLNMTEPIAINASEGAFAGKTFVLTGTLENYSRTQAAELIEARGGKVTSSVSKKTDYVLYGESAGSKYDKAVKLNITLINENDFENMLNA
ncbi:MAG: NAD-dependent DNA ligase LigA [Anaerofustis stercorihominis]|nr:NAD-dependent DNA ligase LigA [Anaerofustis stercorihominis]